MFSEYSHSFYLILSYICNQRKWIELCFMEIFQHRVWTFKAQTRASRESKILCLLLFACLKFTIGQNHMKLYLGFLLEIILHFIRNKNKGLVFSIGMAINTIFIWNKIKFILYELYIRWNQSSKKAQK